MLAHWNPCAGGRIREALPFLPMSMGSSGQPAARQGPTKPHRADVRQPEGAALTTALATVATTCACGPAPGSPTSSRWTIGPRRQVYERDVSRSPWSVGLAGSIESRRGVDRGGGYSQHCAEGSTTVRNTAAGRLAGAPRVAGGAAAAGGRAQRKAAVARCGHGLRVGHFRCPLVRPGAQEELQAGQWPGRPGAAAELGAP